MIRTRIFVHGLGASNLVVYWIFYQNSMKAVHFEIPEAVMHNVVGGSVRTETDVEIIVCAGPREEVEFVIYLHDDKIRPALLDVCIC